MYAYSHIHSYSAIQKGVYDATVFKKDIILFYSFLPITLWSVANILREHVA